MFGNKAGPSKVFKYGCLAPIQGAKTVDEQMFLAHRYRNALTQIELERRQECRRLVGDMMPELEKAVADLSERLHGGREAISKGRKKGATPAPPETVEEVKALYGELKKARAKLKEEKTRVYADPNIKAQLAEIDGRAHESAKKARKDSGLYWGTYLAVEQGCDKARKSKMDPRFERFDGSGHLAVQIQKGLPSEAVFGDDNRVRVDPVDPDAWNSPVRGVRRNLSKTKLWLRVASEGNDPVWAVLPMIMHRPLPANSRVKWVHRLSHMSHIAPHIASSDIIKSTSTNAIYSLGLLTCISHGYIFALR